MVRGKPWASRSRAEPESPAPSQAAAHDMSREARPRMSDFDDKLETQKQWNTDPCGADSGREHASGTPAFFRAVESERYGVYAPWMREAVGFSGFGGKKVLEIGPGLGHRSRPVCPRGRGDVRAGPHRAASRSDSSAIRDRGAHHTSGSCGRRGAPLFRCHLRRGLLLWRPASHTGHARRPLTRSTAHSAPEALPSLASITGTQPSTGSARSCCAE